MSWLCGSSRLHQSAVKSAVVLVLGVGLLIASCGQADGDRPILRSASWPEGLGVGPGRDAGTGNHFEMVTGWLPIRILGEVLVRDGPFQCSLQGRFFVAGQPDARILIVRPYTASDGPLLPRDVIAEFPNAPRLVSRSLQFIIVSQGEEWEFPGCNDFYVVQDRILIDFENLSAADPLRQGPMQPTGTPGLTTSGPLFGTSRVVLPDITLAEPDLQWDVAPENPEDWVIRWIAYPAP